MPFGRPPGGPVESLLLRRCKVGIGGPLSPGHGGDVPGDPPSLPRRVGACPCDRLRLVEGHEPGDEPPLCHVRGQRRDPVSHECEAGLVHEFRADVRHSPRTGGRHPIPQRRAVGLAGLDDPGVRNREVAAGGPHVEHLEILAGDLRIHMHMRHAPAAEPVAGAAVDVQVGPRSRVEWCRAIVRIGEAGQLVLRSRPLHRRERIDFGIGRDDDVREQSARPEVAELVHGRSGGRPGHVAIELLDVEGERRAGPFVVASLAFAAAEEPPGLVPGAARRSWVGDRKRHALALGRHQVGVGTRLVPGIGIAVPVATVIVEKLRLELPLAAWVAGSHLDRHGLGEHGARWEVEPVGKHRALHGGLARTELHVSRSGQADEPACLRVVGPRLGRDLEGRHAGHRLLAGRIGEQPRFREPPGKPRRLGLDVVSLEFMDRAVVVVEDEKFAVVILGEADDADRRGYEIDQWPGPGVARARHRLGADAPHPAGHPVAKQIAAHELRKLPAPIHEATGDRRPGRVRHLAPRLDDRRGAGGPVAMNRVASFLQAPAVVVAGLHAAHEFPHLEADVAGPEVARLAVEAHLPGIAEAEGVEFATGSRRSHERVVGGDRVTAAWLGVIDVDPHDGGPQIRDILPGLVRVGGEMVAAVAGRHVEHPVRAEGEAAAVVAARGPGDHLHLARRVGPRHAAFLDHRQSHHPCAVSRRLP